MSDQVATLELAARCRFGVTLRFELFDAIHVLVDPHSRIHRQWRHDTLQGLAPTFHQGIQDLGGAKELWPAIASVLPRQRAILEFEEMVELLRDSGPGKFQRSVLTALLHDGPLAERLIQGDSSLRKAVTRVPKTKLQWLQFIGLYPWNPDSPLVCALEKIIRQPERALGLALEVIDAFWHGGFCRTWKDLKPRLQRSVEEKERLFSVCTLEEFARLALLRVQVDEGAGCFRAVRGGYQLGFSRIARCTFVPSAFNDRRYWSALENSPEDEQVQVYFPFFDPAITLHPAEAWPGTRVVAPELDVALIFKALGDNSRFAIASLIAESRLSLTQIAQRLGLSKPTVSHHLATLRIAGLLEEERTGNKVEVGLRREIIEQLSALALQRFFHPSSS